MRFIKALLKWVSIAFISMIIAYIIVSIIGASIIMQRIAAILILAIFAATIIFYYKNKKSIIKHLAFASLIIGITILINAQMLTDVPSMYKEAIDAFDSENWDESIKRLESIHSLNPEYEDTKLYLSKSKFKKSEQIFHAAQSIISHANEMSKIEEYAAAIDTLECAIGLLEKAEDYPDSDSLIIATKQTINSLTDQIRANAAKSDSRIIKKEKESPATKQYNYHTVIEDSITIYYFNAPHPPLKISHEGKILAKSANIILKALELPLVDEPGLNVEEYWCERSSMNGGRFYRSYYKWKHYSKGALTFKRMDLGCRGKSYNTYDCLRLIVVGEDDYRDLLKYK